MLYLQYNILFIADETIKLEEKSKRERIAAGGRRQQHSPSASLSYIRSPSFSVRCEREA